MAILSVLTIWNISYMYVLTRITLSSLRWRFHFSAATRYLLSVENKIDSESILFYEWMNHSYDFPLFFWPNYDFPLPHSILVKYRQWLENPTLLQFINKAVTMLQIHWFKTREPKREKGNGEFQNNWNGWFWRVLAINNYIFNYYFILFCYKNY